MEIVNPVKVHEVIDYDFMFTSGNKLAVTVDLDAGDSIDSSDTMYTINIKSKPNVTDPDTFTDEETLIIYKTGLAAVGICKRKQKQPSVEEIFEMQKTVHKLAKLVQ